MNKERNVKLVEMNNDTLHDITLDLLHYAMLRRDIGTSKWELRAYAMGVTDAIDEILALADDDLNICDMYDDVYEHYLDITSIDEHY